MVPSRAFCLASVVPLCRLRLCLLCGPGLPRMLFLCSFGALFVFLLLSALFPLSFSSVRFASCTRTVVTRTVVTRTAHFQPAQKVPCSVPLTRYIVWCCVSALSRLRLSAPLVDAVLQVSTLKTISARLSLVTRNKASRVSSPFSASLDSSVSAPTVSVLVHACPPLRRAPPDQTSVPMRRRFLCSSHCPSQRASFLLLLPRSTLAFRLFFSLSPFGVSKSRTPSLGSSFFQLCARCCVKSGFVPYLCLPLTASFLCVHSVLFPALMTPKKWRLGSVVHRLPQSPSSFLPPLFGPSRRAHTTVP
ncbi:hypothetical protein TRVL_04434 [Trypanosoma vivax]|nr:hypothetical protein TRVL_04434 [Trypanosoma vivax]